MEYSDRFLQTDRPMFDCLLFDLDDTLYPLSSGIATECRKNIEGYMIEKLGIEKDKISDLSNVLYRNYGTTMAGLRAIGYEFDYDDYHSNVHGRLPYENLKPDPVLRNLLLSLPYRKVIFTNADKVHAARALGRLGLEDCFEGIVCFETLNNQQDSDECPDREFPPDDDEAGKFDILEYFSRPNVSLDDLPKTPVRCKPSESAFEYALRIAGIDPRRTIFFDDSARNIQAAKRVGLHTVLVGTSQKVKGADYALESIHNIKEALPELWSQKEKRGVSYNSGKITVETSVTA